MELLALGINQTFFGESKARRTIDTTYIKAALKAREAGISEVKILGQNLALITYGTKGTKRVKYYTCRETSANPETGTKGNTLPWYQVTRTTLDKLKKLNGTDEAVEEVVLLYWAKNKHSYSAAFPLEQVEESWTKGESEGKYRLNFRWDEVQGYCCDLRNGTTKRMQDDDIRVIAGEVMG